MATTYFGLVNKLRDRFNEPHFTVATWATAVGFDQYTKDAINYAYHDILNAEMEWPFLHQDMTFQTTPGTQFYTPTIVPDTDLNASIKAIDWESFYINANATQITVTNQLHSVPSTFPYEIEITIDNSTSPLVSDESNASWFKDLGVKYFNNTALTAVTGDPEEGEYTLVGNKYRFNEADASSVMKISFTESAPPVIANVINPQFLPYMDYDYWRQAYLMTDLNISPLSRGMPLFVFKPQVEGQIGLTPVPDKIYVITFEYWLDADDLSAITDTTLLPDRFEQILIDGASKYCYDFREDPQMSVLYEKRFNAGITRMRIELINRNNSMKTGFHWRSNNFSPISFNI